MTINTSYSVTDVVTSGDVAYFTATVGGMSVIASARMVNGAISVTTHCSHSGTLGSIAMSGMTLHALAPDIAGTPSNGKMVETSTSAAGATCTVRGTATAHVFSDLVRVGGFLFFVGAGTSSQPLQRFDVATGTESTLFPAGSKTRVFALGTDGTSVFFVESDGASAPKLMRSTTDGTTVTDFTTFSSAVATGYTVAGSDVHWIENDKFVWKAATSSAAPTVGPAPTMGTGAVITFCGASATEFAYANTTGSDIGVYVLPSKPSATAAPTLISSAFASTYPCALATDALWWIDNVNVLRRKGR